MTDSRRQAPVTFLFGLPGWGKYAPFPPLATADDSGFVRYHELIPDRKVEWIDYYGDKTSRTPTFHRFLGPFLTPFQAIHHPTYAARRALLRAQANWCLQSNVVPDSRLQGSRRTIGILDFKA